MKKVLITLLNSVSTPVRRVLCGLFSVLMALAIAPTALRATTVTLTPGTTSWTCPADVTAIDVAVQGAGGGGAAANTAAGAIGGGGATAGTIDVIY